MNRATLTVEQWAKIVGFLTQHRKVYGGAHEACRRFLDAVLWILRSGAPWRFLPPTLGHWNTVFKRFARWCRQGVWAALHPAMADEPDLQHVLIDSTIVRAHACAAGTPESSSECEALGRSRGGFHQDSVLTDALGNPLKFIVTSGQAADISQADALLRNVSANAVIGDKSYDADTLIQALIERGIEPVIPPRSNRLTPRTCN